jgi:hypothetical protein
VVEFNVGRKGVSVGLVTSPILERALREMQLKCYALQKRDVER